MMTSMLTMLAMGTSMLTMRMGKQVGQVAGGGGGCSEPQPTKATARPTPALKVIIVSGFFCEKGRTMLDFR